jgi:hypothetical protein
MRNAAFGTNAFHGDPVPALKIRDVIVFIDHLLARFEFFCPHR